MFLFFTTCFSEFFDFLQKITIHLKSSFFTKYYVIIDIFFLYSSFYSDF